MKRLLPSGMKLKSERKLKAEASLPHNSLLFINIVK